MNENTNRPRPKHRTRKGPRRPDFGPLLYTTLGAVLGVAGTVVLHFAGLS